MPSIPSTTKASLTPVSWGGQTINDGAVYSAKLIVGGADNGAGPRASTIISAIPGQYPVFVRPQPEDRVLQLSVRLAAASFGFTQLQLDTLRTWFNPILGPQYLVATDSNGVSKRILAQPETFTPRTAVGDSYFVNLRVMGPWEGVSSSSSSTTITASGQSFTINNPGDTRTYPTFGITPGSLKSHANSWIRRRRIVFANLSEIPISDPIGDGWPVDVASNALPTSTLNGAGKLQAALADLRVVLNGAEINRWPDPVVAATAGKVWANLQHQARKQATLAANINSTALTLTVSNASQMAGWPSAGFFILGTECIQYTSRTLSTVSGLKRGSRNTTAASHTAGDILTWVEHPFLDLIYDYTAAVDPQPPLDRRPAISLTNSTNGVFTWDSLGILFNQGTRRSAAWQRQFTDEGFSSQYMTCYDSGTGIIYFEDTVGGPTYAKPNFNNAYLDVPYGIATISGNLGQTLYTSRLETFFVDLAGNEYRNGVHGPSASSFSISPTPAFRIRLQGRHALLAGDILNGASDIAQTLSTVYLSSFSFICDRDEANLVGWIVRARNSAGGSAQLETMIANDQGGVPSELVGLGQITPMTGGAVFTNYVILPTLINDTYARLQSGQRYHLCFLASAGTGSVQVASYLKSRARQYYVDVLNVLSLYRPIAGVLVDSLSEAQEDSTFKTGNTLGVSGLTLTHDPGRTPYISLSPEEDLYLLTTRLTNTTTGDYVDLYFPMAIGQSLSVDCVQKRVIDSETGLDVPFAASPSNDGEWLPLSPGDNIFTYTETGVVSTAVAWSVRGEWL